MSDVLTLSVAAGVAFVTLNRPAKKNAMNLEMFEALAAMGTQLKAEPGLRVVILSGAGGAFCAGLDLLTMQDFATRLEGIKAQMAQPLPGGGNWFQRPCLVWQELAVPVIAAIDGPCFGAGLQLALSADFRIAAPDAQLSVMEAKWGLIPDMGITQTLQRLVSPDQAKLLMMTARTVSGTEAEQIGLVTEVAKDPHGAARSLAAEIVQRSPEAANGAKVLVDQAWRMDRDMALALEARLQAQIIGSPNQMAAVMAAMTGKPAQFD